MKLLDCIKAHQGGFDIGDYTFDSGIYFECDSNETLPINADSYDYCMRWLAENIEVYRFEPEWFTICHITEFIIENRQVFDELLNKIHVAQWQPKNYKQYTEEDEEFYDMYIEPLEGLISGNYSDHDYDAWTEIIKKYKK